MKKSAKIILIMVLILHSTSILHGMKPEESELQEKIETSWEEEIKKVESQFPVLKVISLFFDDYIKKGNLKLDDESLDSPKNQWHKQFRNFQKALVEIKPVYEEWKKKYRDQKNADNFYAIDGNSWILSYLKLKPYCDMDTATGNEVNFLKQQRVLTGMVDINGSMGPICLKKEIKPFFSFEFIQKACPINEVKVADYSPNNMSQKHIESDVGKAILKNEGPFIKKKIDYFSIKDSDIKAQFLSLFYEDNEEVDYANLDIFSKVDLKIKKLILQYGYNVEAFYRGLMPNVFALFDNNGERIKPSNVRDNETVNKTKDYPQVLLIPGISYISYQTPYTILYGLLIEYAYLFLNMINMNSGDNVATNFNNYTQCLNRRLKETYGDTFKAEEFKKFMWFYNLAQYCNDQITNFDQLLEKQKESAERENKKEEESLKNRIEQEKKESQKVQSKSQGFFASLMQWGRSTYQSIRNYFKPIVVGTAVVGSGVLAYKLWQARMKRNPLAQE